MHFRHKTRLEKLFSARLLLLCIISLVSTGCTMCPSPFDYSGTVPGSANQNNFRLRTNGVLPIWRRPKPWPPIVSLEVDESPFSSRNPNEESPQTSRVIVASHEEGAENEHSKESSVLITQSSDTTCTNDSQQTRQSDSDQDLEPTTNKKQTHLLNNAEMK